MVPADSSDGCTETKECLNGESSLSTFLSRLKMGRQWQGFLDIRSIK